MPVPALCPGHALALALPSTLPSTLSAISPSADVVRGFIGTMQPPPTFRSGFGSSPSRTDPGPPGRLRAAGGLPGSDTILDGSNWTPVEPSQNGPAHVACGGSQRLGLHGKSLSGFRQISRQNAPKPQRLVPHGCGGTATSGRLARNLTEPPRDRPGRASGTDCAACSRLAPVGGPPRRQHSGGRAGRR
jgi:hypothetical protein